MKYIFFNKHKIHSFIKISIIKSDDLIKTITFNKFEFYLNIEQLNFRFELSVQSSVYIYYFFSIKFNITLI